MTKSPVKVTLQSLVLFPLICFPLIWHWPPLLQRLLLFFVIISGFIDNQLYNLTVFLCVQEQWAYISVYTYRPALVMFSVEPSLDLQESAYIYGKHKENGENTHHLISLGQ